MKKIVIISLSYNTAAAHYDQLYNMFSSVADIKYYYLSSPPPRNFEADLVLYSSKLAYRRMHKLAGNYSYIIARRSINYHEIDKLFKLPHGTDALLVNDTKESAEETILLLRTLGIDHINFSPYYPDITNYPEYSVAVTPGEVEIVPSFINKVID